MSPAPRKSVQNPEDELAALERELASDTPLAPAYVLKGEERTFRDRGARLVVRAAHARGLEITRHDGDDPELDLARLFDDLAGASLFAAARCVVIENADALVSKRSKSHAKGLAQAIEARLAVADGGTIVVGASSLPANQELGRLLGKVGARVVVCRRLYDTPPPWSGDPRQAELVQWLARRARARGARLTPEEAVYVAAAVGNDLAALDDALARVAARGREELRELVGWQSGASPWTLAEHLLDGDLVRSLTGIESLFAGGYRERDGSRAVDRSRVVSYFCVALASKLREAVLGAAALERGGDPVEAAGISGTPRAREAFAARVRRRTSDEWRRLFDEAGDVERRTRLGTVVDANDFALLALRWRRDPRQHGARAAR